MYTGYLDKCMPSQSMRAYLKKNGLSSRKVLDIIIGAPVPISVKLDELKKIADEPEIQMDADAFKKCVQMVDEIEEGLKQLKTEGVFSITRCFFSDLDKEQKESFDMLCASFEAVMDYIVQQEKVDAQEPEERVWYEVFKWNLTEKGKYVDTCEYYVVGNEIMYICLNVKGKLLSGFHLNGDLQLPVPFKAGDILEVDGFPFGPTFRMIILSIGDNCDCCCVQGLARNKEGKWECGAVKHGMVSYEYFPKVGYLFTADHYDGELEQDEQVLIKVKDYISGDSAKGEILLNELSGKKVDDKTLIACIGL